MVILFSVKLFDPNVDSNCKLIGQKLHGHAYVQADSTDIQLVSTIAVLYPRFGDAATSIQSTRSVHGNGSVERKGHHDSCTCGDTHSIHIHTHHMTTAPRGLWLNHKTRELEGMDHMRTREEKMASKRKP